MQDNYIKDLFNLQDKSLVISSINRMKESAEEYYEITVYKPIEDSNKACAKCNSSNIGVKDYYYRKIKYLKIASIDSIIIYKQRRFICFDCSKSFNETCSLVDKHSTISNPTKKVILDEFKRKQSSSDIANRMNVSDTTANSEFISNVLNSRTPLSNILCIDEFKASTIAGKYALIIGDPIAGDIIDILPSRKQAYIYYYFQQIPDSERFSVEYVVTDLFESYRTIARNLFWKSTHIADRFHWIRLATNAMAKIRIKTMNMYKKHGTEKKNNDFMKYYEITKKYHKRLLANTYNKEAWYFDQVVNVPQLKKDMTYQEIIEYIVNTDKILEESYTKLQDLYKFAKFSHHGNAEKNLLEWINSIRSSEYNIAEFEQVTYTYYSWRKEIVNSFIIDPVTKSRITNSFIEGKNNFCKVIKRVGFGYKNFDLFRAKILHISRNKIK